MPELSVLLPARNAEATVHRAVTSTLRAMPRDAELVVLDDGSTDSTAAVVRSVRDPRLRLIEGQGSGGVANALDLLLDRTDSDLVARMDADDVSLPWRFRTTLPALDRDADVVFSPVIAWNGRTPWSARPGVPVPISPEAFGLHLLMTNPVSHPTMLARRSVLEAAGGYRDAPSEDYDLWLRLAADGVPARRVATWGLLYRVHPDQVTASADWRRESWDSPEQAMAFADAAERLTGRRLNRLVRIPSLDPREREEALAEYEAAVRPLVAGFPGLQGAFLRRRLEQRLRWTAETLTGTGTGTGTDNDSDRTRQNTQNTQGDRR